MAMLVCGRCGQRHAVERPGRYGCSRCGAELPAAAGSEPAAAPRRPPPGPSPSLSPGTTPGGPGGDASTVDPPDPEVERLERRIAANPADRAAYLRLAQHYLDTASRAQAVATYERVLPWAPDDPFVRRRLEGLRGPATPAGPGPAPPAASPPAVAPAVEAEVARARAAQTHLRRVMAGGGIAAFVLLTAVSLRLLWPVLFPSARPVVRAPRDGMLPVWSPDGRRIAFHARRDDGAFLAVVDLEGGTVRDLVLLPRRDLGAGSYVWSADSSELAYESELDVGGERRPAVFRISAIGGEPRLVGLGVHPRPVAGARQLVMTCHPADLAGLPLDRRQFACVIELATGEVRRLGPDGSSRPWPDPDGTRVVYQHSVPPHGPGNRDLRRMMEHEERMRDPGASDRLGNREKWPDGSLWSVVANDLRRVGLDGRAEVRLTDDGYSSLPRFSRNGRRVYFLSEAPTRPRRELWRMDPDGHGAEVALTGDEVLLGGPDDYDLDRDGERIFYRALLREVDASIVSIVVGNVVVADLFAVAPGGKQPVRLANRHAIKGAFSLSPDGAEVVYEFLNKDTRRLELWRARVPR